MQSNQQEFIDKAEDLKLIQIQKKSKIRNGFKNIEFNQNNINVSLKQKFIPNDNER